MKYKITPYVLALITCLISCGGSAIGDAQNFVPNETPVISSFNVQSDSGSPVNKNEIVIGMSFNITVTAHDPENAALTYTFTSDSGSFSGFKKTETGCSVTFWVESAKSSTPVTVHLSIRDPKGAGVSTLIDIGSGKAIASLTINSPDKSTIKSNECATFTFSATSDGLYQIVESDTKPDVTKITTPYFQYGVDIEKTVTVTIGGSSYGSCDVHLSADEGDKKVWILFQNRNYEYVIQYIPISVDNGNPCVKSVSYTKNEYDDVTLSPSITVTFNKSMDQSTYPSALTLTGGTAGAVTLTSKTATTAVYSATGLTKNTSYTASVKNVKDLKGNTIPDYSDVFTTLQVKTVSFATNGGSAVSPVPVDKGTHATKPATDPTKKYFSFVKWYKDSGCTQAWDFSTDLVLDNTTLYAKWNDAYAIGDTGPSGGWIIAVNPNYDTGVDTTWKYEEVSYSVWDEQTWTDSKSLCESNAPIYSNPLYQSSAYSWGLPSMAELALIYNIKSKLTNGNTQNYWSNAESGGFAQTFNMNSGYSAGNTSVGNTPYMHARAVRKF